MVRGVDSALNQPRQKFGMNSTGTNCVVVLFTSNWLCYVGGSGHSCLSGG